MDQPQSSISVDPDPALDLEDLPPGNHALEVAARRGFGPLSPSARRVWHGDALPCVTCGQLVQRGADQCDHCNQDLREEMRQKMRAHSGPWFVLEHLRPFPGVSLDRIVRQIRRGLITETSIVRGPATDFQWRFAVETPGLCRYFNRCWHCHQEVGPADTYCPACLSHLAFETPRIAATEQAASAAKVEPGVPSAGARPTVTATIVAARAATMVPSTALPPMPAEPRIPVPPTAGALRGATAPPISAPLRSSTELEKLATAVRKLDAIPTAPEWDAPARLGPFRAAWLAAVLLVLAVIVLLAVVQARITAPRSSPQNATQVAPVAPVVPSPAASSL